MKRYTADLHIRIEVEAPAEDDALELVEDTFGLGDLGEGIRVTEYELRELSHD